MISKSNDSIRRILNFPAIRPCESVPFSTLLTSLISLSRTICTFKSEPFFTNKKNARTSIHLIETLLVFLEEIPNGNSRFQLSISLCLSELHFIFQKIHFLLEDCVRDDSRILMMMKSDKVSTHFRLLMRAMSVALDVLPLSELDISLEVKELVEFVRERGFKTEFEVEKEGGIFMRRVFGIIDQFEKGISPEFSVMKSVLDRLGIQSWSECNKEVQFLESEIIQECEKRDFGFLSSLMAFAIYCRCSVFVNLDQIRSKNDHLTLLDEGSSMIKYLNPDDFKCPISLEIMSDPVIISTGHTYERSSILKWFKSGNHTCPKTGERLISVELVPNHALKKIIKKYHQDKGVPSGKSDSNNFTASSSSGAGSPAPAAEQAMKLIANFLVQKLLIGTKEEKNKASYEVRLLTKTSVFNRSCLVEANAILPLFNLISSTDPDVQDNAIAGLMNLSKYNRSKKLIVENGGLKRIVKVLQNGIKIESRQHAAGVLFYLTSVEEYRIMIGRTPGAIQGLMGLIHSGPDRAKKNALVTILGLLMYQENHWKILSGGLVLLLVNLLTSFQREDLLTDGLAVLATLAEKIDGAMAIISAGTLPVIIDIMSSTNSRTVKEYCVCLLLSLCINDGADVVPCLVKNSSLMMSLYSVLTEGTSRSSKKASSLIRILHSFDEKSWMASGISEEQFVHVW